MTPTLTQLGNVFEVLTQGAQPHCQPKEMQARLAKIHGPMPSHLLCEQEGFDGRHHYDVLMHLPDGGMVSMSYAPPDTLPWPMRGVHRHSESQLLRVNGTTLQFSQAVAALDVVWKDTRLARKLVDMCLLQDYFARHPIQVPDAQLRDTMDAFRRTHQLFTVAQTQAWMAQEGWTQERLETVITDLAKVDCLKAQITSAQIEAHFTRHQADHAQLRVACLQVDTEDEARAIHQLIISDGISLREAAQHALTQSCADTAGALSFSVQSGSRQALAATLGCEPSQLQMGHVSAPLAGATGWRLVEVIREDAARLDQATRAAISETLFADWLAQLKRQATVDWYWGEAQYTAQAA